MFVKEIKTRNRKTGAVYVKHALVESIRTDGKVRPRVIINLGRLDLPRDLWPQLAEELSARLTGQGHLDIPGVKTKKGVLTAADRAMENHLLKAERQRKRSERVEREKNVDGNSVEVSLDKVTTTDSRSFGPEQVCDHAWKSLKLPKLLNKLGFTPKEAALAEAVVCGRLIAPGSELSTWKWIRKRSSIGELTETPLDKVGRNAVYRIGDRLWEGKDALESHLRLLKEAGSPSKDALYLFDLTNFYFEGQSLGNTLSARGKSKERRSDAPLVSLGLVVDSEGFPVMSQVFPGNISEPSTLEGVLSKMGFSDDCLPGLNPTLAMDRGIATAENVKMLKEKGFPYVLITRGPRNSDYLDQFENRGDDPLFESFERDGYAVHLKKILHEDGTAEVLCVSDKKQAKEESMKRRWIDHAMEDFARLQKSVRSKKSGSVRKTEKVAVRIGRLSERYPGLSKQFKWKIVKDPESPDSALDLTYERIPVFDIEGGALDPLSGTYVIESTHGEKSAEEIWRLYMTLTKVEKAFRSMKSDLGTRPIFHQKATRTEAHLFISVMAFHLLCHIERSLRLKGINREWRSVRTDLSTHQRSTIIIQDEKSGETHHVRVSGTPEASHESIYRALGIKSATMRRKFFIARL